MTVQQNSFQYRMGAGFPGDINRAHPASVEPVFNDATNPVLTPGLACVINSAGTGVRQMAAGDTAVAKIWGISVRAFPTQDPGTGETYGGASIGVAGLIAGAPIDVLKTGYINAIFNDSITPKKGDPVYVWVAATTTGHIQGGLETSGSGSTSALITNAVFNGPPDASGYGEVIIND